MVVEGELEFYEEDHVYTLEGRTLASVTQVITESFPLNVSRDRLEYARNLGRMIHRATELYDLSKLDFESLDSRIVPYLDAWIEFRKQTGCTIVSIEQRVHSALLRCAGTIDRTIELGGRFGILDLKRPRLTNRVGVQLAGYKNLYIETMKQRPPEMRAVFEADGKLYHRKDINIERVDATWGLQLCPNETPPYRLREYKGNDHLACFLACLNIHHWRRQYGE